MKEMYSYERVMRMERIFKTLSAAADAGAEKISGDAMLKEMLDELTGYYENGMWLIDYEADEKGLFPDDMIRGVLSQDAVFDLLETINDAENRG